MGWCRWLVNASQLTVFCQALCEHHDTVYILDANNQPVQSTPELLVQSLILLQIIIAICTCLRNNFGDYAYIQYVFYKNDRVKSCAMEV